MTDRLPTAPLDGDATVLHDQPGDPPTWAATPIEEEHRQRRRFEDEMRPLLDSLDRLRERGLLE